MRAGFDAAGALVLAAESAEEWSALLAWLERARGWRVPLWLVLPGTSCRQVWIGRAAISGNTLEGRE